MKPGITRRLFGTLPDGRAVHEYTLDNGRGLRLSAINYGGIVTSIECADRAGRMANVCLGFASLDDYVQRNPHFGTLVGRYGNRLAGGPVLREALIATRPPAEIAKGWEAARAEFLVRSRPFRLYPGP